MKWQEPATPQLPLLLEINKQVLTASPADGHARVHTHIASAQRLRNAGKWERVGGGRMKEGGSREEERKEPPWTEVPAPALCTVGGQPCTRSWGPEDTWALGAGGGAVWGLEGLGILTAPLTKRVA